MYLKSYYHIITRNFNLEYIFDNKNQILKSNFLWHFSPNNSLNPHLKFTFLTL